MVSLRQLAPLAALSLACGTFDATVLAVRDGGAPPGGAGRDGGGPDGASTTEDARSGPDLQLTDADTPAPAAAGVGVCRVGGSGDGFYDSFDGSALDPATWLVASGPVRFGERTSTGGFAPENVSVQGGALVLSVRGDAYAGSVRGRDGAGQPRADGRRTGAAIATRDLYASGTYQVAGHFTGPAPALVEIWFTRDDVRAGALAMAVPGTVGGAASYAAVHAESRDDASPEQSELPLGTPFDDGASHILRFDWYTTADNAARFWVDDTERWRAQVHLPSRTAGRLWIVAWLPGDAPADFDTAELRIDNAFVTPFGNDGDVCSDGALTGPFLVPP